MKKLLYAAFAFLCLPALAQTRRFQVSAITAVQSGITAPTSATYYVLKGGGTRYSSAVTTGQCDGTANVTYAVALAAAGGATTNLHCAWGDYRYSYDDQSYNSYSGTGYGIKGGDTLIVGPGPWRVGWDAATGPGAGYTWCLGGQGACQNPTVPSGTPTQHTRIIAACYPNCDKTNMTQLYGGFGLPSVLNLSGAQYVDVIGFEITRHSNCIWFGSPAVPSGCSGQTPVADYDSDGIYTNTGTHDLLLQDMWIHGHPGRGIKGPIGGVVTCLRCDIAYNGGAGWDFDDGNATPMGPGAVWNFLYSTIEWSGCNQDYPDQSHAISCYGQSSGGYGDGVGTPAGTGLSANIDHSQFLYNTQDGLDLGHVDTGGPYTLSITNSVAYGNGGATFKWAIFSTAVFTNNVAIANCMRMSAPITGQPSTYNKNLGDFCRAGDALPFNFRAGSHYTVKNNTIVTYAPTTFDMQCWDTVNCSTSSLDFENNIIFGYDNPATYTLGGKAGGPGGFAVSQGSLPPPILKNNTWFGVRDYVCAPTEICASPQFVAQPAGTGAAFTDAELDNFNIALATGSPSVGQGASSVAVTPPPPPVVPSTPTVTWNNPASIVAGTALSGTQLNAKASVLGSFTYSPAAGTVLSAGTQTLSATFTPADTANYTNATASVQIVVTQPTPVPAPVLKPFTMTFVVIKTCTPTVSGSTVTWACK